MWARFAGFMSPVMLRLLPSMGLTESVSRSGNIDGQENSRECTRLYQQTKRLRSRLASPLSMRETIARTALFWSHRACVY